MGSRVRIRLLHILHFVKDFLFPLLKNSKSGVDDRGHCFRSGSPLTNYPHATPGAKMGPLFESPLGPLLTSGMRPLCTFRILGVGMPCP